MNSWAAFSAPPPFSCPGPDLRAAQPSPSWGPSRGREIEWGIHAFVPVPALALTLRERQKQKENRASAQISEEAVALTEVAPECKLADLALAFLELVPSARGALPTFCEVQSCCV